MGVSLGLLPPEGRDLVLAGALLSITLNPFVFATVEPVSRWVRARPSLANRIERGASRLSTLPNNVRPNTLRDHAVLVGYGRVGSLIGTALAEQGLPFIVVENDLRLVESLRKNQVRAIYRDASAPGALEAAFIGDAKLLIIATPDGYQARRILELARERKPQIDTVVRTHTQQQLDHFQEQKVGRVVMGEQELARGMAEYAVRGLKN
jgi:CPA2 family monovalent cation:H+ antiporter-2